MSTRAEALDESTEELSASGRSALLLRIIRGLKQGEGDLGHGCHSRASGDLDPVAALIGSR